MGPNRKIANTPSSESFHNLFPARALIQRNMIYLHFSAISSGLLNIDNISNSKVKLPVRYPSVTFIFFCKGTYPSLAKVMAPRYTIRSRYNTHIHTLFPVS